MNAMKYAENPNMARKIVFMEDFDYVQCYFRFYRETTGFTKYYQYDYDAIIKKGREHWQSVMNSVNANAIYYGDYVYGKVLIYLNTIKKLVINEEKKKYPIINDWNEKYPELLASYQKLEQNISEENAEEVFMEYFNELRITANKEYLKLM